MRLSWSMLAALAVALLVCNVPGRAALDIAPVQATSLELLVFEHPDCVYCRVFRRDVVPRYQRSSAAVEAPLRFIDIEKSDIDGLGLKSRITMVPTVVLMKDGAEVDRISGYWAPESFFKLLAHIIARAE